MKYVVCLLPLLFVTACNKADIPIGFISGPPFKFAFTGFGETLEPGYLKVFSDSSREQYRGIDSVNGTLYLSTIAGDSTLIYYTFVAHQYAGYKLAGQDPIIFDAPLPSLPARWSSDTAVARTATFTVGGNAVSITDTYTLLDTAAVVTPLGSFSPAPHFLDQTSVSVSNGGSFSGSQEFWLARGPGEIITIQAGQSPVYFIYGFVNGVTWGGTTAVQKSPPGSGVTPEVGLRGLPRLLKSILPMTIVQRKALFAPSPPRAGSSPRLHRGND
jgi:hypothetical protein